MKKRRLLYESENDQGSAVHAARADAGGVSKPVYFLFTALFAIGYAAVWLLCWRCPFCGERLGRSDGETCPHCGKSLLAPRGHQT